MTLQPQEGYEATAIANAVTHPVKAVWAAVRAIKTEGDMAPEIPLDRQRPAARVYEQLVAEAVANPEQTAANARGRQSEESQIRSGGGDVA